MAMRKLKIGVSNGNDLPLLRQAKTTVDAAGWLGTNTTVGRPTAARDRPAATMEDGQRNIMLLSNLRDALLTLIERPVGHDISPILVAVGITDHDHLSIIAGSQMLAIHMQSQQALENGRRRVQILDRFEERDDLQALIAACP